MKTRVITIIAGHLVLYSLMLLLIALVAFYACLMIALIYLT